MALDDLPEELLLHIMSELPNRKALATWLGCCKRFRRSCSPDSLRFPSLLQRMIRNENLSYTDMERELARVNLSLTLLVLFEVFLDVHLPSPRDAAMWGVQLSHRYYRKRFLDRGRETFRLTYLYVKEQDHSELWYLLPAMGDTFDEYECEDYWRRANGLAEKMFAGLKKVYYPRDSLLMLTWTRRLADFYQNQERFKEKKELEDEMVVVLKELGSL